MSQLTAAVLGRALTDYPALDEMAPGCSVAVNVSARNLLGRGLVSEVHRLLAEHQVPADRLTLEVTEPAPGISPAVNETISGLVRLGCRVSVAEFGTGHSSLMALSRYAGIRELKLDSGLVSNVLADRARATASPAPSSARRTRSAYASSPRASSRPRSWPTSRSWAATSCRATSSAARAACRDPGLGRGVAVTAPRPVRHGGLGSFLTGSSPGSGEPIRTVTV